jgi:hypothetical protein
LSYSDRIKKSVYELDYIVFFLGIEAIVLISFLVIRNQKDKKELVKHLNEDYYKTKDEVGESEIV